MTRANRREDGQPVNFTHGAVVGPALNLVHAEIIAALRTLATGTALGGIREVAESAQRQICQPWADRFLD